MIKKKDSSEQFVLFIPVMTCVWVGACVPCRWAFVPSHPNPNRPGSMGRGRMQSRALGSVIQQSALNFRSINVSLREKLIENYIRVIKGDK